MSGPHRQNVVHNSASMYFVVKTIMIIYVYRFLLLSRKKLSPKYLVYPESFIFALQ